MEKKKELPPLEAGLLRALQAIDNQVRREMQRTPAERETQGVQKWEPFQKRIERSAVFLIDSLGAGDIEIDSLVVLSQALTKSLKIIIEDLGEEGLGQMRSSYCRWTMEQILKDAGEAKQVLSSRPELS